MKQLTMKGTIRRNRDNCFIDLWHAGERFRLYSDKDGETLDSRKRAERLLSHIRYEMDHGTFNPADYSKQPRTILQFENYAASWLERQWLMVRQGQRAAEYIKSVESYLRTHLVPFFGTRPLKDVYEGPIEDFLVQLPPHLSPKTQYNILAALKKILNDAYRRREIGRVPVFPRMELKEPEIKWLDQEQQQTVLTEITDPIMRAFFQFLMQTGCRHGEARALRWERINMKEGLVVIAAAMDGEVYRESTKEKNIRVLPLPDATLEMLRSLPRSISGYVFAPRGKPINRHHAWIVWNRAAKKLGIEVRPYQGTRHSLASQLVNDGVSLGVVQDILGHKTPEMVRRYAKFKLGTLRDALNRKQGEVIPLSKSYLAESAQ